jgi:crotonobetainyl-CoA:carnitine CoA-transferase CaiB-like acyl-CoA transferase
VATLAETPAAIWRHAPLEPGEHSIAILRENGYTDDEIRALFAAGAVLGPELQPAASDAAAQPAG